VPDLDLPERLQDAVAGAYVIERELGGGGMSRLFVATERSLNRQVVIKVLPPDLSSAVSAARFRQEIELAAQLQHPHIVPILTSGASNGLLYYIMPFVRGESVKQLLATSGKLPVRDAVRILSEVATALGYAHRRGIVHRDIKPGNILMADGVAVLADFGVARAIFAARETNAAGDPALTATGMSVGTPTYMAPEQALAEGPIDGRADLYALGIVGYEMLAGQHPFSATSGQAMIMAHLTQPAPEVGQLRPETPPSVNAAIARTLEKEPGKRFRTAEDFRQALENVDNGAPIVTRRIRPRTTSVLVAIAAVAIAAVAIGMIVRWRTHVVALDANMIAVAPFDVVDPDLKLWHEGMVDVLARNLDGAGPLRTVSPSVITQQWTGRGDRESAAALGKATGAGLAVFGSLIHSGSDSVSASISVVDAGSGSVIGEVVRRDAASHMDRLTDSLTVGLLRELGRSRALVGAEMSSVGTSSLPALKAFLRAEQFFRESAWDSAFTYYERATTADSQFAIALSREGRALAWTPSTSDSEPTRARPDWTDLFARAVRFNRGLAPHDSLLVATYGLIGFLSTNTQLRSPDYATLKHLYAMLDDGVTKYPNDPEIWLARCDAQYALAWGPVIGVSEREVLHSCDRAIALDSSLTPAYLHAVQVSFRYGTAEGRRHLAGYLSQHPADVLSDAMRLAYRLTDPSVARDAESQHTIDTASNYLVSSAADLLAEWPDSAETVIWMARRALETRAGKGADSLTRRDFLATSLAQSGHAIESMRTFPDAELETQFASLDAMPSSEVDSLMAAFDASFLRPGHCWYCVVSAWGIRGDTVRMQRQIKHGESDIKSHPRTRFVLMSLRAWLALALHDTTGATREFAAFPDSLCNGCGLVFLTRAQLFIARGKYTEAAKVLDERGTKMRDNVIGTITEFERGRVAEKLGDKPRAREAYAYVADMWQHGDPVFQRYVGESRAGLRRLNGERGATQIPLDRPPAASH
jgi:eukaryotic-like serine/threonine-protein kinase